MPKTAWIVTLAALTAATAAVAQTPDLRGTWKGESESIIMGPGNPHHAATPSPAPRLNSVPFTLTIDKQDGRRISGTFSSMRHRPVHRRHFAQRDDLHGGRRRSYLLDAAGAEPAGALLYDAVNGNAHCLMHGAHQTAIVLSRVERVFLRRRMARRVKSHAERTHCAAAASTCGGGA
jgi:hypothetical protein